MPNPMLAVVGASTAGSLASANAQKKAASSASKAQQAAADAGIAEQQRQFDKVQELLAPFVTGGTDAFTAMANLAGVGDAGAQQTAIEDIIAGPEYQAAVQQGEAGILSNAAATGGLRGGNTQAALGQFRPQMLSQAIGNQYNRLGGLASMGQASAAGTGNAAQLLGQNTSDLLAQSGAAQAGAALARGQATQNMIGGISQGVGSLLGSGGLQPPVGATMFSRWGF